MLQNYFAFGTNPEIRIIGPEFFEFWVVLEAIYKPQLFVALMPIVSEDVVEFLIRGFPSIRDLLCFVRIGIKRIRCTGGSDRDSCRNDLGLGVIRFGIVRAKRGIKSVIAIALELLRDSH